MKVLVVGQGAREHTLVWKIAQSPRVEKIYCIPGNPGISEIAECPTISLENNLAELADFAESEKIELTVIGPEAPLVAGIVDIFQERGLRAFGPDAKAAILEGSKNFAKQVMTENCIPTATYRTFDNPDAAIDYIKEINIPVFVKADGACKRAGRDSRADS